MYQARFIKVLLGCSGEAT